MHFLILNVGAPLCDSHYDANVSALAVCAQTADSCTGNGRIECCCDGSATSCCPLLMLSSRRERYLRTCSSEYLPRPLQRSVCQEITGSGKVGAWLENHPLRAL